MKKAIGILCITIALASLGWKLSQTAPQYTLQTIGTSLNSDNIILPVGANKTASLVVNSCSIKLFAGT